MAIIVVEHQLGPPSRRMNSRRSITSSALASNGKGVAQCLCRFEVYHLGHLLAAADHRATEFLRADWMDYGSARKTGI
jgi:hypothetical protein